MFLHCDASPQGMVLSALMCLKAVPDYKGDSCLAQSISQPICQILRYLSQSISLPIHQVLRYRRHEKLTRINRYTTKSDMIQWQCSHNQLALSVYRYTYVNLQKSCILYTFIFCSSTEDKGMLYLKVLLLLCTPLRLELMGWLCWQNVCPCDHLAVVQIVTIWLWVFQKCNSLLSLV